MRAVTQTFQTGMHPEPSLWSSLWLETGPVRPPAYGLYRISGDKDHVAGWNLLQDVFKAPTFLN